MINHYVNEFRDEMTNLVNSYLQKGVPASVLQLVVELNFNQLNELTNKLMKRELEKQQEVQNEDQLETEAAK